MKIKNIAALIAALLHCSISSARVSDDDKLVLEEATKLVVSGNPRLYLKRFQLDRLAKQRLAKALDRQRYYSANEADNEYISDPETGEITLIQTPTDSLIITAEERKYLEANIIKQFVWDKGLLPDAIRVRNAKVGMKLLQKINTRNCVEKTKQRSYLYAFTQPVYIRDKSICLVFTVALAGRNSGISDLSFYKKTETGWKRWIGIYVGEF